MEACHEQRMDFTPLVHSVDSMAGREKRLVEKRLVPYLAEKWHRPYSQMAHYVKVWMQIAVVQAISLLCHSIQERKPCRPFLIQCGSAVGGLQTLHKR